LPFSVSYVFIKNIVIVVKLKKVIRNILKEQTQQIKNNAKFLKWFSNSKIVISDKPLICYHGSSIDNIKTFDLEKIGYNTGNYGHYGYGIYFSTDIREAKKYGSNIYQCYINIKKPFIGSNAQIKQLKEIGVDNIDDLSVISIDYESFKDSFKNDKFLYEFIQSVEDNGAEKTFDKFLKDKIKLDDDKLNDIVHIIEYTTLNKNVNGVPDYILDMLDDLNIQPKVNKDFQYEQSLHWITDLGNRSKDVTEAMKKLGYDGVWYGSEIIAFDSNQIKSINNNGEWNKNSNNIYN